MTLGTKLQNLRKSKNMSQENLAEILNVSRQAVSKWELDQSLPDTANIISISEIFSVTTDYLLLDKEPSSAESGKRTSKNFTLLICAAVSSSIGFVGNFILYVASRFIKVPTAIPNYKGGYTVTDGYDFSDFIYHHKLSLLFYFFIILFILGIALAVYHYRAPITAFIVKIFQKIKNFKFKKKSDTTD